MKGGRSVNASNSLFCSAFCLGLTKRFKGKPRGKPTRRPQGPKHFRGRLDSMLLFLGPLSMKQNRMDLSLFEGTTCAGFKGKPRGKPQFPGLQTEKDTHHRFCVPQMWICQALDTRFREDRPKQEPHDCFGLARST